MSHGDTKDNESPLPPFGKGGKGGGGFQVKGGYKKWNGR